MNIAQKEFFNKIFIELPNVNKKINKIKSLIESQNISTKDKVILKQTIYGNDIIDDPSEIQTVNFEKSLLYSSLSKTIEDFLSGKNIESITENERKKISGFLSQSIEIIILDLELLFSKKESFFERLKSDYLSDEELQNLLKELSDYFNKMTKVMIEAEEI